MRPLSLPVFTRSQAVNGTRLWSSRWPRSDMPSEWRKRSTRAFHTSHSFPRLEIGGGCGSSLLLLCSHSGGEKNCRLLGVGTDTDKRGSGNGLVSYYINLILEGVGITKTETKSIINGCLQLYNFVVAMGAAMLVDVAGRRTLFLISNVGMLCTFICWTVATALYDTANNVAAAKGELRFSAFV